MRVLMVLMTITAAVWAHGGGFRDGGDLPPGLRAPSGIPCACAKIECDNCATRALREGKELSRCTTTVTELKRWGDIARVRIEVTLETQRQRGSIEGYARLEPAPVFAAVAGSLKGELELTASLQPSARARKIYLWERRRFNFDPLLVLRRGAGRLDLRAFPIGRGKPVVITLEGYTWAPSAAGSGVQLYRTGQRCLAVAPRTPVDWGGVAAGDRTLRFLTERECRARFPEHSFVLVPCVPALEAAATGRGRDAASGEVVLAAFAPGVQLPPRVGPDSPLDPPAPPAPPPDSATLQQERQDKGGAQKDTR